MSTVAKPLPFLLSEVNALDEEAFVIAFGPLFEHSPWIARETWPHRPFTSRSDLKNRLAATMKSASLEKQVALISAHPDLAGRLAREGRLTNSSKGEQSAAGLDRLIPEETGKFQEYNRRYREKFGFPFVICARLNDKTTILRAFEQRLESSRRIEIEKAIGEIEKIAELRLESLVSA